MNKKYDFSQISASWYFCFNHNCPLHEGCLRYQSALELPANVQRGNAIYPHACQANGCSFFRADQPVVLVTGFVNSKNPAMNQAFVALRHRIENVTGSGGSYYLYRNGKRWLSPQQQEQIRQIFAKEGYPTPTYDHSKEGYDFT